MNVFARLAALGPHPWNAEHVVPATIICVVALLGPLLYVALRRGHRNKLRRRESEATGRLLSEWGQSHGLVVVGSAEAAMARTALDLLGVPASAQVGNVMRAARRGRDLWLVGYWHHGSGRSQCAIMLDAPGISRDILLARQAPARPIRWQRVAAGDAVTDDVHNGLSSALEHADLLGVVRTTPGTLVLQQPTPLEPASASQLIDAALAFERALSASPDRDRIVS